MKAECPLCGHGDLIPVLHREKTVVSANVLYETETQAQSAPVGNLTIVLCARCGFVFNATFDRTLVPYGEHYQNDQSKSERFLAHMQDMASRVRRATAGQPLHMIEVGCGQGQFLRLIMGDGWGHEDRVAGFDPSYIGDPIPGCDVQKRYFELDSVASLDFEPNVVVSRHVIEHIEDPIGILGSIRIALKCAPTARVFFETPSIQWIFENDAFWDLCYEHCSYFSPASLAFAFEASGFATCRLETVFSGQYLWIEAVSSKSKIHLPGIDHVLASRFVRNTKDKQAWWRAKLMGDAKRGKVAVWGAATKGVMFVQHIDPDARMVNCLIDINPMKQNRYVPVTAHPVVDWQSAMAGGVSTIIVTNPNYLAEIQKTLGPKAATVTFVSL
jgi:SAM-dependent methyltransferase